ncbi:MAG: hypothetical protein HRT71_21045 [Flavobacteriales bacterium]|nr:hypothetical protein [Flavobacteriales bacterium]
MSMLWMIYAFGAMFGWGLGQGFTKKYIGDVTGTKFCLYFFVAIATVNLGVWSYNGAPNPFYTETGEFAGEFVFWATLSYILDGVAWVAYFICIKYAPIAIVGTVAAAYPAIVMVVLLYWTGVSPTPMMWVGGIVVVTGCIGLGYTPKSAVDPDEDRSHVIAKYWIPLAIIAAFAWAGTYSCLSYIYSPDGGASTGALLGATPDKQLILSIIGDGLILVPFALIAGRKTDTHDLKGIKLAALPMMLFAVGNACMLFANPADPTGNFGGLIAAISAAYPMVTFAFACLFLKEKIISFHWLMVCIVLLGITLVSNVIEVLILL